MVFFSSAKRRQTVCSCDKVKTQFGIQLFFHFLAGPERIRHLPLIKSELELLKRPKWISTSLHCFKLSAREKFTEVIRYLAIWEFAYLRHHDRMRWTPQPPPPPRTPRPAHIKWKRLSRMTLSPPCLFSPVECLVSNGTWFIRPCQTTLHDMSFSCFCIASYNDWVLPACGTPARGPKHWEKVFSLWFLPGIFAIADPPTQGGQ